VDFGINLPADMEWGNERFEPPIDEFALPVGPTEDLHDSVTAIDFFLHFFDNELIEEIVQFTNIHVNAEVKGFQNWRATTSQEMKSFLAFLILSNDMLVVPRDERYFLSTMDTKIFHVPNIQKMFPFRKRLFELKRYVYFVNPWDVLTEDEQRDPLYKIRKVSASIIDKCKTLYNCNHELSVDETMIPFKGRLTIKVRMPGKPVKFGVKFFTLCESKTGYCKNIIYAGKDDRDAGRLGKMGQIVMELVKDLYGTGHHLYMDNFSTNPVLSNLLRVRGILAAGTARPRQGYPSNDLKSVQLQRRGQVAWLTWEEMIALR